jgi:hypothetical protein
MVHCAGLAPGVDNLLTILECLTATTRAHSQERFDGTQYGALKKAVADVVTGRLTDIQGRYHEIVDDQAQLAKLLTHGADRARAIAAPKLAQAYRACALRAGLLTLRAPYRYVQTRSSRKRIGAGQLP